MATTTGNNAPGKPANVLPHKNLYQVFWLLGWAIVAVALYLAWMTRSASLYDKFGITFDGGPTMLLLAAIYLAISLKMVRENKVAAAFSYGKALVKLDSGLHFLPFGLMQIKKGPRTVQEFQCPGEPEKVFKGDDKEDLPPGMVRPIRVVTGGPKDSHKDDLLNTRMTLILSFFVQWDITDVLDYASNYGSTDEIEKQVRDISEAILAEIVVGYSPASFIDGLLGINATLAEKIGQRFENAGIKIISTRLISPDVSHSVSDALSSIPKEKAAAATVAIKAEGEKTRRIKEGEGTAAAELALLEARAKGRKKMKDDLGVDGEAVLASEAVRGILAETDVLVFGQGGMTDAMSFVKAAQSTLNSGTKKGGKAP